MLVLYLVLVLVFTGKNCAQNQCQKRQYSPGQIVCVCNSNYCDSIPRPEKLGHPQLHIYTSNKEGLRFSKKLGTFSDNNAVFNNIIRVDSSQKFQRIEGWGGAFTDSTGININSLEQQGQENLLKSYFSEDGIEYNLCRVPIGGTDFSLQGYSYDDGVEDPTLANFKLAAEDFQYKIPHIKKAKILTGNNLKLFASAWTAPKWMKTNNAYAGLGFLKENMYQAWADYFVKFLDNYKKEGIEFWGITTGNEPSLAVPFVKINSVGWLPTQMGRWIKKNLGPTIRKSDHSKIKILMLDDQRFLLPWFINVALVENATRKFVDGIAVHWYYDNFFPPSLLTRTQENFPEKFILATEACRGDKPGEKDVILGSWTRGESYSNDIIQDLTYSVVGWTDWNMALDLKGGPTYIGNYVDSPIIVNATAGEFYKQPMFYNLGHFSKFVPRDSVRVLSSGFDNEVPTVAFQRPDNGTVVVILNKKEDIVSVSLIDNLKGTVQVDLSAKSITTLLYW